MIISIIHNIEGISVNIHIFRPECRRRSAGHIRIVQPECKWASAISSLVRFSLQRGQATVQSIQFRILNDML